MGVPADTGPGGGSARGGGVVDVPGIPKPGERIASGKYEIEKFIGKGGMGVVVSAMHLQLGERVAIKFLLPSALESEGAVQRFVREARAAVRIKSEHVVRILDVDTLPSGAPYMVMEYLVGADLGEMLQLCGPIAIPEAIDYLLQACEGTAEAHACGFVHRDLKPENLFVTETTDGSPLVKVLDFGISKSLGNGMSASRVELTSTRSAIGSPLYMSPEQLRNTKDVDTRTDIWSLGVVLHELVSGRTPFMGDSVAAVAAAICVDGPIPLRRHLPSAPAELEAVILKCLDREPARRFADVAALASALAPFGTSGAQSAADRIVRRLSAPPRPSTGPRSRPASGSSPVVHPPAEPPRSDTPGQAPFVDRIEAGQATTLGADVRVARTTPMGSPAPSLSSATAPAVEVAAPPLVTAPRRSRRNSVLAAALVAGAAVGAIAWLATRPNSHVAPPRQTVGAAPHESPVVDAPPAPAAPPPITPAPVEVPTVTATPTSAVSPPAAPPIAKRPAKRPRRPAKVTEETAPLEIRSHR